LNAFEFIFIAVKGSNDDNNVDVAMKSTENYVWAIILLEVVNPLLSYKELKPLIDASVVKLGLAM